MFNIIQRYLWTVFATAFLLLPGLPSHAEVLVAAASNIMLPLNKIVADFEQETGVQVKISYGSSGILVRQILRGAPFEILISADRKHVDILTKEGYQIKESEDYAIGRLAIFLNGNDFPVRDLPSLISSYKLGKINKFAIANPNHAPYGQASREVLQHLGIWEAAQSTLVIGESAIQAAQFAVSGSTDGGFLPLSLILSANNPFQGNAFVVPEQFHKPLYQKMALLSQAGTAAFLFYNFLRSDSARSVFISYGYAVPVRGG